MWVVSVLCLGAAASTCGRYPVAAAVAVHVVAGGNASLGDRHALAVGKRTVPGGGKARQP